MKNLVKMTRSAFTTARTNRTLVTPNVALISDEVGKIEYTPFLPTADIGIASWENNTRKFYSLEEWNALATKPTALGVYVFAEQSQFIIHGEIPGENSLAWSNSAVLVSGCSVASTAQDALLDFAGEANTQAVIDAIGAGDIVDAPLFSWARSLTFADPNAVPYIPACGELELIRQNLTKINELRNTISQDAIVFPTGYSPVIFSSTQANATKPWQYLQSNWGTTYAKSNKRTSLAVCSI